MIPFMPTLNDLGFTTRIAGMDRAISASEANQHFSELLRDVAEGQSFTVMSRGRPVARVLPVDRDQEQRSVDRLLRFVNQLPLRRAGRWSREDLYE
jgi:prevent-host-death family protein